MDITIVIMLLDSQILQLLSPSSTDSKQLTSQTPKNRNLQADTTLLELRTANPECWHHSLGNSTTMLTIFVVVVNPAVTTFARTRISACIVVEGRIRNANEGTTLKLERPLLVTLSLAQPNEIS